MFGTSQGPTQPLMVSWTRFNRTLPPFTLKPLHRNFRQPTFRVPATTTPADGNLPEYEARRFERVLSVPIHKIKTHDTLSELRGNNLVELRMKASSEVTWIKAASNGFRNPKAAMPTPILSTTKVPTKFCMMMP